MFPYESIHMKHCTYILFFFRNSLSGTMPKRKGKGRPKRPTLQKKVKLSADVEVASLDNPSNALEVVPVLVEELEAGTHTVPERRERVQPGGSALHEKIERSADVEVAVLDNPSTALEVDPVLLEEQDMGRHGLTLSYSLVNLQSLFAPFLVRKSIC